jgi:hypothetical protein
VTSEERQNRLYLILLSKMYSQSLNYLKTRKNEAIGKQHNKADIIQLALVVLLLVVDEIYLLSMILLRIVKRLNQLLSNKGT